MTRALSLYLPMWPIDRLRRRRRLPRTLPTCASRRDPGSAVLLVRPDHGREVVAHACERARDAGVHPGMTLAHARALLHRHDVFVEPEQPEQDLAALHTLARWANRIAPAVAVDPPVGLLMDVTGCARLYRGEARLAARLAEAMQRFGVRARLAIAPTCGAAWACARFCEMPVTRLDERDLPEALAPLPVAALRIDADIVSDLAAVGVERIGHLLDLPRTQLIDRFGDEVTIRIDQALGRRYEAIEPVRAVPEPCVERVFDGPAKQYEAIQWTVRDLVERMSAKLGQAESGVRELRLCLDRVEAEPVIQTLRLGYPSRDAKHLWALLRPMVERLNLGDGVEGVRLTAVSVSRLALSQRALGWAKQVEVDAGEAGRLIDLLSGRLGADRVLWAEPVDTHVPEKTSRMVEARAPGASVRSSPPAPWSPDASAASRPTVLLERAQPIEVTLMHPEGPVLMLHEAEARRVVTTIGPERIELRWWRAVQPGQTPPHRDYYKLQLEDGRWLWVFRESGTGRWFLHGKWN